MLTGGNFSARAEVLIIHNVHSPRMQKMGAGLLDSRGTASIPGVLPKVNALLPDNVVQAKITEA